MAKVGFDSKILPALGEVKQRPPDFGIGGVRCQPFAVFGAISIFMRRRGDQSATSVSFASGRASSFSVGTRIRTQNSRTSSIAGELNGRAGSPADGDGSAAGEIALPQIGSVEGITGRWKSDEAFFGFQSFAVPSTVYRYDLARHDLTAWAKPNVPVDASAFEVSSSGMQTESSIPRGTNPRGPRVAARLLPLGS